MEVGRPGRARSRSRQCDPGLGTGHQRRRRPRGPPADDHGTRTRSTTPARRRCDPSRVPTHRRTTPLHAGVLRASARTTTHFRPPIHPAKVGAGPCRTGVEYRLYAPSSRLAMAERGIRTTAEKGYLFLRGPLDRNRDRPSSPGTGWLRSVRVHRLDLAVHQPAILAVLPGAAISVVVKEHTGGEGPKGWNREVGD